MRISLGGRKGVPLSASTPHKMKFSEPFIPRHPWRAAFLLATVATPAGVVLAWLAPRPIDALIALPLVLLDIWAGSGAAGAGEVSGRPLAQLLLLILGIALTWLLYIIVVRLVLWRLVSRDGTRRS